MRAERSERGGAWKGPGPPRKKQLIPALQSFTLTTNFLSSPQDGGLNRSLEDVCPLASQNKPSSKRPQINKQSSKYNGVQLSVIKPKPNQLLTTELLNLLTSQQNSNRSKNNTCLKMFFTSLTFGVVWDYYCSKLKGKQYKLIT